MTFVKTPGKDPTRLIGEAVIEGSAELDIKTGGEQIAGVAGLMEHPEKIVGHGVEVAQGHLQGEAGAVAEVFIGSGPRQGALMLGGAAGIASGPVSTGGILPGGLATTPGIAAGGAGGALAGLIAEEMPIFEDKAITSTGLAGADTINALAGAATARLKGSGNLEVEVGSGDSLDVRQFSVHERLSSLFQVNLVVRSDNPSIDFDAVVGQAASFAMHTGTHDRLWTGLCNHIDLTRVEPDGLSTYQISIVPTFWLLTQRKNHRMFQQISEPDIVLKVLEEWGINPDVRIDRAAYKKRKYRVQYGESDFAFISRMLEDAGITYFFEQAGDEARLVLSDAPQSNPPRGQPLTFADDTSAVRTRAIEYATDLRVSQRVRPGKVTLRDHDYRRPPSYKLMTSASGGRGVEEKLERFHYTPGAFLFGAEHGDATPAADDKGKTRTDEKEGAVLAKKRLNAKRGSAKVCSFETNAHDLSPGVVMSIQGHPHAGLGSSLLVVECSLTGADSGDWSQHCNARGTDVPFVPELSTPKPKVSGVESATVVGPAGEEIHTDEFGRVRVHFHWDRESKMDDNSSCWIHVSQPWGGSGYGGSSLPRVGQEVLVDFLGGNPDRPIIVGRVYTNLQKTPYKLPENKTQSGWKSNSTGGGGGYNELMFEDAQGKELVNIQAQRDLKKLVKNNEFETTGVNQTITVGKNRNATIGEVDSALVGKAHSVTIAQAPEPPPKIPPTGTAMSDQNVSQTTGLATLAMTGPDVTLTAAGNITMNAGANITLCAGANIITTATANIVATAGVTISNTAGVSITTLAGAVVSVKAGAVASVEASSVAVKGDMVEITASGPVDINGAIIDLN